MYIFVLLFCVRFSMLFTAPTASDVDSFGVELWPTLARILEDFLYFSRLCLSQYDLTLLSLFLWPEVCIIRWIGIPASSRAEMVVCVDFAQACSDWYFLHHVTEFIHSNRWIFKPYLVAREKISLRFLKQCSLVRIWDAQKLFNIFYWAIWLSSAEHFWITFVCFISETALVVFRFFTGRHLHIFTVVCIFLNDKTIWC